MKYEIFERPEVHYVGLKLEVDMKTIEESNIGELWTKLFADAENLNIDYSQECIGLEKYSKDTMETGLFDYYALAPTTKITDLGGYYSYMSLPAGKYIKFPVIFKDLGPKLFKSVYDYIKANDIKVDYNFDFELYPTNFNSDNPDAELFIAFRMCG
jgi:predicted transcriptional regulator YdeE